MGSFNDWSTTPASNASVGAINWAEGQPPSSVNNSSREEMAQLRYEMGAISSAESAGATTDLGAIQEGSVVLSGSATISSFGTTGTAGLRKKIRFTGTPTLTHSSNLILPGSVNLVVASGDLCDVECEGAGVWRVRNYQRANGKPIIASSWETISSASLGSQTSLDITSFDPNKYKNYRLTLSNLRPATDSVNLLLRTSTDGGSNYDSSAGSYRWAYYQNTEAATGTPVGSTGDTSINVTAAIGNSTNETASLTLVIYRPDEAIATGVTWEAVTMSPSTALSRISGSGLRLSAEDVNAIRVLFSSGNIAAGNYVFEGQRA